MGSSLPGAIGTTASIVGIAETADNHSVFNNGKTSICLRDEIRGTDGLLGKKYDWETEKYEKQYLQEVSPKEYCRIM